MPLSRSSVPVLLTGVMAGIALGVLAPLLGAFGNPAVSGIHIVLSAGWAWAALAFLVGLARESRIESAVLAPVSLVAAVIAYHLTKAGQGEFRTFDLNDPYAEAQLSWGDLLANIAPWCIAAALFGALLGLAGNLARVSGIRGLPFRVLIPFVAIVETTERLRVEASLQVSVAGTTWRVVLFVAVAAVILTLGHTVIAGRHRSFRGREAKKAQSP